MASLPGISVLPSGVGEAQGGRDMRPVLPLFFLTLLTPGCGPQGAVQPTGPVLSLRLAQDNGLVLRVGFGNSENKLAVQDQVPIRLKNHLLTVSGTIGLTPQKVLDITLEVENKKPLTLEFAGFPEATIMRDGKVTTAAHALTPGKHQFRITYRLIPLTKSQEKKASGQTDDDSPPEDP
jgi:hypothetical protein